VVDRHPFSQGDVPYTAACGDAMITPRMAMLDDERREARFRTLSGESIDAVYTADDLPDADHIGAPGEFPFTRGVYPTMYRGRPWTIRLVSGFGTPAESNARYRYLVDHGQTALSAVFDMPTLMGLDSDDPRALGEVGRGGTAVDTAADMDALFAGLAMDEVSTNLVITGPAAVLLAFYVAAAERRGLAPAALAGTTQTDVLKEYIAQNEWCFPIEPALRVVDDMVEFCAESMPRWHALSISGYHIREAGSTAAQELAFTLKDGFTYVERALARGLDIDSFAPRLSFFFNAHIDFFEEIAKYRAARRIWARELRDTYGAKDPKSWLMRFHTQTSGVSLTAQLPLNNVVRTALEALSAVLGGTQSLHTNSYDEALSLPTAEAARLALHTQHIIAGETGVASTIDPLGGSYFVEALTSRLEARAREYLDRIDELGGMVAAIEAGFPQREIADASYAQREAVESGEQIIVGINRFADGSAAEVDLHGHDHALEHKQVEGLRAQRAVRDAAAAESALTALRATAATERNVMPALIDCARADCTLGEIVESMQTVFGTYKETPVL
jgi:methylmalonyl-CoA mutase N-terminal domain/subunit